MSSPFGQLQTESTIAEQRQLSSPPPSHQHQHKQQQQRQQQQQQQQQHHHHHQQQQHHQHQRVLTSQPLAKVPKASKTSIVAAADPEVDESEQASDSEAETIVLPERRSKRREDGGSRDRVRGGRGGGGLGGSSGDEEWESDGGRARRSKRHRKWRADATDLYSSELSSLPSAPSSPVGGGGGSGSAAGGGGRGGGKGEAVGVILSPGTSQIRHRAPRNDSSSASSSTAVVRHLKGEEQQEQKQEQTRTQQQSQSQSQSQQQLQNLRSGTLTRKRKAPSASASSSGSNSNSELRDLHHENGNGNGSGGRRGNGNGNGDGNGRGRTEVSPKRQSTRSSPVSSSPPSPPPPPTTTTTLPSRSTRAGGAAAAAGQTSHSPTKSTHKSKQRKTPRPLMNLRGDKRSSEDRSPSSSRQGSPSSSQPARPSAARTPGPPSANMVKMPHKPKKDPSGRTMLHLAAQRGNLEEVIQIYNANKDLLNAEDNAGYIPLHEASLKGHADVVKFLLDSGSWVDVQSVDEKDTPLIDAVDNGHLEVVKLLLEFGADPKRRNKSGADALECLSEDTPDGPAIEDAIRAALRKRRSKRSSEDDNRNSATVESHSSRDPSVASPVHETSSRQKPGRRRNARSDQTKNEMLWVEGGKNGLQKLREKARVGDNVMVGACLERGVEPDVESLIGAIKGGHDETVSLLLAFNAQADPEPSKLANTAKRHSEETPMLAAIGRNNLKILQYLLDRVDPFKKDGLGRSYIDIARERAGDHWEREVELIQQACDKARQKDGEGTKQAEKLSSSNKKNKVSADNTENSITSKPTRTRRDSLASLRAHKRSESVQSKKEESDGDFAPEHKLRPKERKRRESDAAPVNTAPKKKRRLVQSKELLAKELLAEKALSNSSGSPKPAELASKSESSSRTEPPAKSESAQKQDQQRPSKTKMETKDSAKDIDMLDIPEVKQDRRERSRDRSAHSKIGSDAVTKEVTGGKQKERELTAQSSSHKPTRSNNGESEKKKRRREPEEKDREVASPVVRKFRRNPADSGSGSGKDKKEDLRVKKLESEAKSDASGKEDEARKSHRDPEALKARRLAKEEEKKKKAEEAQERAERAERVERKKKEKERREREEQERKEEARALEERERQRVQQLAEEQRSIMEKACEESKEFRLQEQLAREKFEREQREEEERRIAELKRIEFEVEQKRLEEERKREEERLRQEEEERKRQEEEERKRIEEEAKAKAAAEEAERRRLEEEAERQRKLEAEAEARRLAEEAEEKRRIMEEEARQAEIRRREALPYSLRIALEEPIEVPTVDDITRFLPFYTEITAQSEGDGSKTNGDSPRKPCQWILNVQAALVLGITDLSFADYHLEKREVPEAHRLRMWQLLRPMLSEPITMDSTMAEVIECQKVNKQKFLQLNPLFWMKLDDFNNILQSNTRYSNLLVKGTIKTSWVDLVWASS